MRTSAVWNTEVWLDLDPSRFLAFVILVVWWPTGGNTNSFPESTDVMAMTPQTTFVFGQHLDTGSVDVDATGLLVADISCSYSHWRGGHDGHRQPVEQHGCEFESSAVSQGATDCRLAVVGPRDPTNYGKEVKNRCPASSLLSASSSGSLWRSAVRLFDFLPPSVCTLISVPPCVPIIMHVVSRSLATTFLACSLRRLHVHHRDGTQLSVGKSSSSSSRGRVVRSVPVAYPFASHQALSRGGSSRRRVWSRRRCKCLRSRSP